MEDFVTFEIAKKLKEKGYPMAEIPTGGIDNRNFPILYDLPKEHPNWQDCKAWWVPTISQVLKWLRDKKKIALNIEFIPHVWQYKILDMSFENNFEPCGKTFYMTYEEAAIAGIEYVLDKLI